MIKAHEAKVGYFYREAGDDVVFLVGERDSVKDSIHVWYYNNNGNYFYDKHLHDYTVLQEWPHDAPYYIVVAAIFEHGSYFSSNF